MEKRLLPGQWSKEKIWNWYNSRPWLRGCNYLPSDCVDPYEEWQEFEFDEKMKTVERELDLAASIGFNSIRVRLHFEVWAREGENFIKRFDCFLKVADKRGISVMPRFGQDCLGPKDEYFPFEPGKQREPEWGYHGGFKKDPWRKGMVGWSPLENKENEEKFYEFLKLMAKTFGKDERVVMWELWNEPGNSGRREMSTDYIKRSFEVFREMTPIQPLTCCGGWSFKSNNADPLSSIMDIEKLAMELSDVVNFHHYGPPWEVANVIRALKERYGRPLIITEWLHRIFNNNYFNIFPLLFMEQVGSYSYGLVAGKAQFYEPWEGLWEKTGLDLKLWQHDLFRKNHRPYDPEEIKVIQKLCSYADARFEANGGKI
jgi:hypothetical protein